MKRGRPKLKKADRKVVVGFSISQRAYEILRTRVKGGQQSAFISSLIEFYDSARSANEKINYTDIDAHLFGEDKS